MSYIDSLKIFSKKKGIQIRQYCLYHIFVFTLRHTPCNSNVEGLKGMERDWARNKTGQPRWPIEDSERASEGDEGAKNKQINKIDVYEASRECR